jgi:branched-chain amino acid transport system ATP-binding protein
MSVVENVLVAAEQGGHQRGQGAYRTALRVLDDVGLRGVANEPAGRLTLMQRKRLELAKSLATMPRLLLLDEVAGGLTEPEVDELVTIVTRLRHDGLTVIWIEHVVRALVGTVDRLVCLAGGRFIGDGSPADVLASAAVREAYLGADTEFSTVSQDGGAEP